jgi:hypothetical protein
MAVNGAQFCDLELVNGQIAMQWYNMAIRPCMSKKWRPPFEVPWKTAQLARHCRGPAHLIASRLVPDIILSFALKLNRGGPVPEATHYCPLVSSSRFVPETTGSCPGNHVTHRSST